MKNSFIFKDYLIIFQLYLDYQKEREESEMYLRILKKDLKRKKTMNIILLIFIILAATFIASGANNVASVMTALDSYFEKAEVPDYWFVISDEEESKKFEKFAGEKQYQYQCFELMQVSPKNIKINSKEFKYSNTTVLTSPKHATKVFDSKDEEITKVEDGEVYVTAEVFYSDKYGLKKGDTMEITANGKTKKFKVKGCTKDAMFGSSMVGITRIFISENDYKDFAAQQASYLYSLNVYTDDPAFMDIFNQQDFQMIFNVNRKGIKTMYIMDIITAAVMMIVSACLILIAMVILRFTINFTMSEEVREIGVMKAIGITNKKIRQLYIFKYFAISIVGSIIGLLLSFPFGTLMTRNLSRNIIISGKGYFVLNIVCALLTATVVVLFCYFCTRKIKKFSPIDAIRNGEKGERYKRKSVITLSKSGITPVIFMAVNDIVSGIRRFAVMILIFMLGILLILIPINTMNTLESDNIVSWFSMAHCDYVVGREMLLNNQKDNEKIIDDNINNVKNLLLKNNIPAKVFQEVFFRMTISHNEKKMTSMACQGKGDVTTDMYSYLEGTPPQNNDEVAIAHVVANNIDAGIGDTVVIKNGDTIKKYIVTALYQTMNNFGEGIRFYQEEQLDYRLATGCFGLQIKYTDNPDNSELRRRKDILKQTAPDTKVYSAGKYINEMIGDVAGQLESIRWFVLVVVLCINVLVTVLMVKSFITKEKGEIGMLKAIGFKNSSLIAWQTIRIGIVILIAIIFGTVFSTPVSQISAGQIFKIMGAQSIEFTIKPLQIYVIYPLLVLVITVFAGMVTASQARKISVSETSNIE